MDLRSLFVKYLEHADTAFDAFSLEPFTTDAQHDAAYIAKDARTEALCTLKAEMYARGIDSLPKLLRRLEADAMGFDVYASDPY